jgi:hypothetical protein
MIKTHDASLGQMTHKFSGLKTDVQVLEDRPRNVEAQIAKIVESPTHILAKFAGKPEPNPVESVKMMTSSDEDMPKELNYSHAPTHGYTMEDFVKMMNLRSPSTEGQDDAVYKDFFFIRLLLRYVS